MTDHSVAGFQHRREVMLHEVDVDFAALRAPAQAADRHGGVGKQRAVARLQDQAIEELEAAPARFEITATTLALARRPGERSRRAEALEIERGRIARRVGLVVVEERAGLVL